jgi:uncharacterized LabA/DUF88 family protein
MVSKDDVMVFFDGANLYHAQKHYAELVGLKIYKFDYGKLLRKIVGSRNLVRATFYGSKKVPEDPLQSDFFSVLRDNDIMVKILDLKKRYDPKLQRDREFEKGVDVALVTDMLNFALKGKIGTAILVSGDSDYISAIDIIINEGVNVEVVAFLCTMTPEWKKKGVKLSHIDDFATDVKLYSE